MSAERLDTAVATGAERVLELWLGEIRRFVGSRRLQILSRTGRITDATCTAAARTDRRHLNGKMPFQKLA